MDKEYFLASYWGQKVKFDDMKLTVDGKLFRVYDINDCTLILRPISMMSEKDAIVIANLLVTNCPTPKFFENVQWKVRFTDVQIIVSCDSTCVYIDYDGNNICMDFDGLFIHNYIAYQHLKYLGYALPFMDKSVNDLVELGWLKLNLHKKKN